MNSNGNTDDKASSVPSKDSSSDTKPIASKDNKYSNVNVAFPNGNLNSTETTLSETQFHLDGK